MHIMYQFLVGIILCRLLVDAYINLQCNSHNESVPYVRQTVYFEAINTMYIFPDFSDYTCVNGSCGQVYDYEIYKWNLSSSSSWLDYETIKFTPPAENWDFWSPTNNVVVVNNKAYFIGMVDVINNYVQHEQYIFDPANDSFMIADIMHPPYTSYENCLTTNG
eukprot:343970_1